MKFCIKCGRQIEDSAAFCNFCGQAQSNVQQPFYNNGQANYNQPVNNQNVNYGFNQTQPQQQVQQPFQPAFQQSVPQPKKGLKVWQIILIVVGAILLLGIIIGVVSSSDSSGNDSGNNGYYEDYEDSSSISYTKGETKDDVYVNEWANLKIDYNDVWGVGTQEAFDSYENNVTDCGFLSSDDEGNQMALCFEKLTGVNKLYNATDYLEILEDGMVRGYDDLDISSSVSEFYEISVAGENYKACDISLNDGAVFQRICVRVLDDYAVSFIVTSYSISEIEEKLDKVQSVN